MAKYSYEFKKKVAQAYPNREGSYRYLAKKYKVSSGLRIVERVYSFKESGSDGPDALRRRKKGRKHWD